MGFAGGDPQQLSDAGDYAAALETAQGAVRSAYLGYDRAEDDWRRARSMGEEQLASTYRRAMTRFVAAADTAQDELRVSRTSAEQALGQELEQAAAGMMPAGIALDPGQLRDARDGVFAHWRGVLGAP